MTPPSYAPSQKVLHWAVAVLIVALVPIALAMANLPDGPVKNALYEWHKSFGLTVLALALARLLVRAARGAPRWRPACPPGSAGRPTPRTWRSTP